MHFHIHSSVACNSFELSWFMPYGNCYSYILPSLLLRIFHELYGQSSVDFTVRMFFRFNLEKKYNSCRGWCHWIENLQTLSNVYNDVGMQWQKHSCNVNELGTKRRARARPESVDTVILYS